MSAVEVLVARERWVVGGGLAALALLAWWYLWIGAGMDMPALVMTKLALFPHLASDPAMEAAMVGETFLGALLMWWVMMIAMMTPAAAPFVLLYGRAMRHAAPASAAAPAYAPTASLALGYLAAWLGFSAIAAALELALQPAGLLSPMLWSKSAWLSAAVLAAAGAYQLSPLKYRCLAQCRSPIEFLVRRYRPGASGALVMGLEHGTYCVGCCWLLMALLFVGGVMNLAWIAALAVLVLVEKLAPSGPLVGKVAGGVLLAWAAATLALA